MPELPEVETVRAGLARLLPGRSVSAVQLFDSPKSFPNDAQAVETQLIGAVVTGVERRGKVLLLGLSTQYSLMIHLKMTGQLVFVAGNERFGAGHPSDSLVHDLPDASTRVCLQFADGSALFFNDQRKFGWVRLLPTPAVEEDPFIQRLGPEPLDASFTASVLAQRLRRRAKTNIKAALLDQSVLAGVGNIYADESLWGAQVHPLRIVGSLSSDEITRLHTALVEVLHLSITQGGSSNHTYVDAEGRKGSYMRFANVFRREGQACPRCGHIIEKMRVAGRGTHICEHCQKII